MEHGHTGLVLARIKCQQNEKMIQNSYDSSFHGNSDPLRQRKGKRICKSINHQIVSAVIIAAT